MKHRLTCIFFAAAAMLICLSVSAFAGISLTPEELDKLDKVEDIMHCYAMGDVDGDGKVTSGDARAALRLSVKLDKEPEKEAFIKADVDFDEIITAADARKILRISVGLDGFPDHKIIEVVVLPPTCSTKGLTVKLCTTCMKIYSEQETDPTGHVGGKLQVIEKPTCQQEGRYEQYCMFCGKLIKTGTLGKTDHDWTEWEYPDGGPSCTEAVTRQRYCKTPGCKYHDKPHVEIEEPTGEHNFRWVYEKDPTCTEEGLKVYKCTHCGQVAATEIAPAKGHFTTGWTRVAEPTCTEPGLEAKICKHCGEYVEEREIPALGHEYDENLYKITKKPTCSEEGKAEVVCMRCGNKYEITLPKTEHTFVEGKEWTTVKEPTCTEPGEKTAECVYCGVLKEEIPATGHSYEWTNIKAPTCTAEGISEGTCKVCGAKTQKTIAKLPHNFEGSALIKEIEPTCGEPGRGYRVCSICKTEKQYEEIPATGKHTEGTERTLIRPATCTEDAVYGYKCKVCGKPMREEPEKGTALGHDYGEWVITKPATCTEDGLKTRTCSRCDMRQTEIIKAVGKHQPGVWQTKTEPTCSKEGEKILVCPVCGEVLKSEPIAKLPHTPGKVTITTAPTCTGTTITNGKYSAVCSVCGEKINETEFTRLAADSMDYIIRFEDGCNLAPGGRVAFRIDNSEGKNLIVRYRYGKDKNFSISKDAKTGIYAFTMPSDVSAIEKITIEIFG